MTWVTWEVMMGVDYQRGSDGFAAWYTSTATQGAHGRVIPLDQLSTSEVPPVHGVRRLMEQRSELSRRRRGGMGHTEVDGVE